MNAPRILLHTLFVFVGVSTTMLGPLLPSLTRRWSLTDSEAGALFTALFFSAVVGSVLVTLLMRRFHAWSLMLLGYALCGTGVLGFTASAWIWGILGACVCGFGLGLLNPTANLAAASLMPERPATAINLLNFYFTIGATLAPAVIASFVDMGWIGFFPVAVAVPILLGSLVGTRFTAPDHASSEPVEPRGGSVASGRLLFFLLTVSALFVYVGVETSSGGWSATYVQRAAGTNLVIATGAPAAFWGALLISRLAAVWLLRFTTPMALVLAGALLALAGSVLMLMTDSPLLVISGLAVTGLGLGPVFANTLAHFLEHYGPGADRISGLLFAAGGSGGALLPLVIGEISDVSGSLRVALLAVPAAITVLACLLLSASRARPVHRSSATLAGGDATPA